MAELTAAQPAAAPAIGDLPTPCGLVDLETLERNAAAMRARAAALGVRLRPHVKSHKSVAAGVAQCGGRPGPITVSTLTEGEHFAAAGFDDIVLAVAPAPERAARVVALAARLRRFATITDDAVTAAALAAATAHAGRRLEVLLEVDCGHHRAGVDPCGDEAIRVARTIAGLRSLRLRGVLTHAGHAYACRNRAEARAVAEQERAVAVAFAARVRAAGVDAVEVSVGSTPTAVAAEGLAGVTEMRPGNYLLFDAFQAAIGSCRRDDCAFTVLATVISCRPDAARIVLDAGALALSKDEGPRHVDPACGYGLLLDRAGRPLAGARLVALSQEHGVVQFAAPEQAAVWAVGTQLRIVPNHACLAAAMFDRYQVVAAGRVVGEWRPARGWEAQVRQFGA